MSDVPLTIDVLENEKRKGKKGNTYLSISDLLELIKNTHHFIYPIINIKYVGPDEADSFAEPNRNKGLIRQGDVLGIDVKQSQDYPGWICIEHKDCYLPSDWYLYDDLGNKNNLVKNNNVEIFEYIGAPVKADCNAADEELKELAKELEEESVKKERDDKIIKEIYEDISIINTAMTNNHICEKQRAAASGGKSRKSKRSKTRRGKTRRNKRRSSKRRR
jgi:hypothetical protein